MAQLMMTKGKNERQPINHATHQEVLGRDVAWRSCRFDDDLFNGIVVGAVTFIAIIGSSFGGCSFALRHSRRRGGHRCLPRLPDRGSVGGEVQHRAHQVPALGVRAVPQLCSQRVSDSFWPIRRGTCGHVNVNVNVNVKVNVYFCVFCAPRARVHACARAFVS